MNWESLDDDTLQKIFPMHATDDQEKVNATNFLKGCLLGDPKQRFQNMYDILNHSFLSVKAVFDKNIVSAVHDIGTNVKIIKEGVTDLKKEVYDVKKRGKEN